MMRAWWMLVPVCVTVGAVAETVGKRPYEMDWANRTADDHPPLVDFENLDGWRVETSHALASFEASREQQLWGARVGRLTYRADGAGVPEVRLRPPAPVPVTGAFDAVTCWIYGNNWGYARDPSTPPVEVAALFTDAAGRAFDVPLATVNWTEWFLGHRRLPPDRMAAVASGARFEGLRVRGGRNTEDRRIWFDNLAVFVESFAPLAFEPRPARGVTPFPGQGTGLNTGPGRLPFPTREETILPPNPDTAFTNALRADGDTWLFTYAGPDGTLSCRVEPRAGLFDGIVATWAGRGGPFHPCVGGGMAIDDGGGERAPDRAEYMGASATGGVVTARWRFGAGPSTIEGAFAYRMWGRSLVVDVAAPGGGVAAIRWGRAQGLDAPRLVTLPYYTYGQSAGVRPAVVVAGPADAPLFVAGHTDWTRSNASLPWAENGTGTNGVAFNGGVRYVPRTDGRRNDCFERFFLTVAPRFEDVLPVIPNPVSPWKHVTGTHVWRAHGAGNREHDVAYWTKVRRHGMTEVVVTDHETGWRDGGESFTFRTRAAPGKGGDEGQAAYARTMQDRLGFVYGPYNNFTDFAPVNGFWSADMVSRTAENQLQRAWMRCYAPKPARAVEYCARLAPEIQRKFGFSTAYCDVHTAVTPWSRVDYDARVPGAGTFAAVFYAFGEIMLLQKKAWNGPVYSEGNNHFPYCGLTDGNYAQDQAYAPQKNPWLVDFDLRRMHDLGCNFGMGNPGMFFGRDDRLGRTPAEMDAAADRFLAATVAFGHPGFLLMEGGYARALRSYYMLQQLHSRYTQGSAAEILYAAEDGRLLDSSAAVASGAYRRSQVAVRYANGCCVVANGNLAERMRVRAFGRDLDLPPNGYAGWTDDGAIEVVSGDRDGQRCDYAATPAYLYVDGRGAFARFPKAAGNGVGICRTLPEGRFEVILFERGECGFAVAASKAVALDEQGAELGPAELRIARGLTYVMPVSNAFSYILSGGAVTQAVVLAADRDAVVAGETVRVRGRVTHACAIPAGARPGDRVWREFEGAWIDFTVVPLADVNLTLSAVAEPSFEVSVRSHLPGEVLADVAARGARRSVKLTNGVQGRVRFPLEVPDREAVEPLEVVVRAGALEQRVRKDLLTIAAVQTMHPLEAGWQAGQALRGGAETTDLGTNHANVGRNSVTCGGVARDAIAMHPPYLGGVGCVHALFPATELPSSPTAAFRAWVGKGDGSDPGDGILYRVAVVDAQGRETVVAEKQVTKHAWEPIEADLGAWAGRSVRVKLVADVGPAGNSSGDWGCWAECRIESRGKVLKRTIVEPDPARAVEPGGAPVAGLTEAMLRGARRGWLRYDGMGLSGGSGKYGSLAVLNGVRLGPMAPAGGDETAGRWAEGAHVALTSESLATLGFRNRFELLNEGGDHFKARRFRLELELADGRACTSSISAATFTQPEGWPHGEGIRVPMGQTIAVDLWFPR